MGRHRAETHRHFNISFSARYRINGRSVDTHPPRPGGGGRQAQTLLTFKLVKKLVNPLKSGDNDYLMNEIRTPNTGTRCRTPFDKWYGIFYVPSRTITAGHTKDFDNPVMDHCMGSQSAPARGRFELPPCRSTVEHANHQTTFPPQGSSPYWGDRLRKQSRGSGRILPEQNVTKQNFTGQNVTGENITK